MVELLPDLISKPQREIAGSDTASRFDYQKNWAFCQMMRRHISGDCYMIAFEYHDDVLFLTPADKPTRAEFYQVKTSTALIPRTLSSITARPRKKSSIVGKMFTNFDGICASHDIRVVLVSNTAFEFTDSNLCAKDLDEKLRNQLLKKMDNEVQGFDKSRLENLHFMVTGVSLEAMGSFLEGEASELFCHKFGEDHGLNIRIWIRLIQSEITRRNNFPSNKITSVNELIKKKCIDQCLVNDTLDTMNNKAKQTFNMSIIEHHLNTAGWSLIDIIRLQKEIPEASRDFYDPLNREVKRIVNIFQDGVVNSDGEFLELSDFLHKVIAQVMTDDRIADIYKKKDYLHALGALVYHDKI